MGRFLSIQKQKLFLRKELLRRLEALGSEERTARSKRILKELLRHPKFFEARSILIYIALPSEVETRPLVEEARRRGKKVYAPCVDLKKKLIGIIEVTSLEELEPGRYGIPEPPFSPTRMGRPEDLDLAVVPGVGFDREGGRLGRGEGYFDRFLEEAKRSYKIGLAFECQVVEKIPRTSRDVLLDEVLIG